MKVYSHTNAGSKFGRIGVLAGGPSSEREVSLRSGKAVYGALIKEGLDAVFLDIWDDVNQAIEKHKFDVAFIALHGRFGEDGTVQKALEEARIPYTGSNESASRLALDKIASKEMFGRSEVPTPRYRVLEKGVSSFDDAHSFGFPMVVKPQYEGSSIGLSVVRDETGLEKALAAAYKFSTKILLEEFIEGRELTVGVLNDRPLPAIEIITKNRLYDYTAKYSDPETKYLVPAPLSEEMSAKVMGLGIKAHKALGCCAFSRTDMMLDAENNIFVLEVNTIPGMTERSLLPKAAQAAGLSFNQLCIKLIENAYEKAKKV